MSGRRGRLSDAQKRCNPRHAELPHIRSSSLGDIDVLILPIQDARPGMKLAMTVTDPAHPEKELLTAGYPLDELLLDRLRDLGITVLYVAYPDLSDLDRHLAPYLNPARREIYQHIKNTIATVQACPATWALPSTTPSARADLLDVP